MDRMDTPSAAGEDLSRLRQDAAAIEELEREAARRMLPLSIQESVAQWLSLQHAFEAQLLQTAHLSAAERQAALAELQARLRCLVEPRRPHGGSIAPVGADTSGSPD